MIRALMAGGNEGKCSAISERFKGRDRGVVPDHGSGLKIGDFHRLAGHEGRRVSQGPVNVGSFGFHEGRGAGKTDPPRGVEKSMLNF
jgi:hypothetical protein